MKLLFLIYFIIILCSCRSSPQLESLFHFFKDQTLTELASKSTKGALTQEQKAQLLILFLDMEETQNCPRLIRLVENNDFSEDYEESHNLNKGFLFDIFHEYTYEDLVFSGLDLSQEHEQLAYFIASAWKTKFSTARINSVLADLTYCYPY